MPCCILIVTYPKATPIAEFTALRIAENWSDHPPAFLAGSRPGQTSLETLTLRADPADWVGIARDAAEDLLGRGFTSAYLILDDQFPVGRCHPQHLNATLPRILDEREAANISLYGHGQCRSRVGRLVDRHTGLERLPTSYPWRFALHPALWNLHRLYEHTRFIAAHGPMLAWGYEKASQSLSADIPAVIGEHCYRIDGLKLSANSFARAWGLIHRIERGVCDAANGTASLFRSATAHRLRSQLQLFYRFYEGPYPYYWSGGVLKGSINSSLRSWASIHRRSRLVRRMRELEGVIEALRTAPQNVSTVVSKAAGS